MRRISSFRRRFSMGVSKGIRSILSATAALVALAATPARAATTLTVEVTPPDTGILVGQTNDYTVTITNTGTEKATNVVLNGTLPTDDLKFVSADRCKAPNTVL